LRTWASLVTMSHLAADKAPELVVTTMMRARLCELIGPKLGLRGREFDLFMLGMLSLLDALMDKPMAQLLPDFPVAEEVKMTLLGAVTPLSRVFDLVRAYERGDWDAVAAAEKAAQLSGDEIGKLYAESVQWADEIFRATTAET